MTIATSARPSASTGGREEQPVVKNSTKYPSVGILLAVTAFGGVLSSTAAAKDCKKMDQEVAIANIVTEHAGGKVLKVEESVDAKGCVQLRVRILIDGTIKAITIPNETGA